MVRLALGAAFLRAARFSFLRSSLSSIFLVSAKNNLFPSNCFRDSPRGPNVNFMVTGNQPAKKAGPPEAQIENAGQFRACLVRPYLAFAQFEAMYHLVGFACPIPVR